MAPTQAAALRLTPDQGDAGDSLDRWRSTVTRVIANADFVHADATRLFCEVRTRAAGALVLLDSRSSPFVSSREARHIRLDDRDDLMVGMLLSGEGVAEQDERRIPRRLGTFAVADMARPYAAATSTDHHAFGFSLPRERVERVLGPARRFSLLTVDEAVGSGPVMAFLLGLYGGADAMGPERAAEMAEVGIELVVDALARRIGREAPIPHSAALLLYRAKAYIASRFADPALHPPEVAAALGISLRHLQGLFRREDSSPAEWIWGRRLAAARDRLAAPGFSAQSVAEIAYGCGFSDPTHFSRRFKAAFGAAPRDWRHRALVEAATGRPALPPETSPGPA